VPLPEILRLGIAQYSARLVELLEPKGWRIENRVLHSDGQVRSWFRLLPLQPAQDELDLCGRGRGVEIPKNVRI